MYESSSKSGSSFKTQAPFLKDGSFTDILDSDGYCFVENLDVLQYESNFDKIIIYSWNRVYPKDLTFNIDLNNWECVSEFDFVGNSHDNITERVYIRKEKKDEE